MKLSIVMPTYNDEEHIEAVISSFLNSWHDDVVELIVVDDESTDATANIVRNSFSSDSRITLIEQENSGPAVSRNKGTALAKGDVILFTQGDIYASESMLARHCNFHNEHLDYKHAMIGYITWYKGLEITPFMKWLENGGPQFDFNRLTHGVKTDFMAFYTPNLSVKKEFLNELGGFDIEMKGPAGLTVYEDTELGWRAQKAGMELIYDEKAIAFHDHYKSLTSVLTRRELEGEYLHLLYKKHPDFSFKDESEPFTDQIKKLKTSMIPDSLRVAITKILFNRVISWPIIHLAFAIEKRFNIPIIYKIACGYHYNKGVSRSIHEFNS